MNPVLLVREFRAIERVLKTWKDKVWKLYNEYSCMFSYSLGSLVYRQVQDDDIRLRF